VRPVTLHTGRGPFAAFDAMPPTGICERRPALLVPGFTGSKEDFLAILRQLAAAGRRVVAIDMRGQYETRGDDDPDSYSLDELGADIGRVAAAVAAGPPPPGRGPAGMHLLGHSFGGLVARQAILAGQPGVCSLTLMSSGPGKLTGPAAAVLSATVDWLHAEHRQLAAEVKRVWDLELAPQARADGSPPHIVAFLEKRMLANSPAGLLAAAEQLLGCPDRTDDLAMALDAPILVLYGEHDDKWETPVQEEMARRLGAQRVCIPGATHSPAVEAPETTASALTAFWNAAEAAAR
jgi:pimeloyl-ACP methyl ester carboxylesterase